MIEPFTISIPDDVLADLRRRLAATRWPIGVANSGGETLDDMRELVRYWRDGFDWHRQQSAINEFHHFRSDGVHFIHERSSSRAMPLLLLHGWPGSFVEMLDVIPLLRESFHVVVPSLPGYGFSDVPAVEGMSNERMAGIFADLMAKLGYRRFIVQGGDWGAGIATWIARKDATRVAGVHLNYIPGS